MTAETRVVDYADTRPAPATIKADGYVGVIRYIVGGRPSKLLTAAEAKKLHAAGLPIGVVYETTADRAKAGRAAGVADAKAARAGANRLGVPTSIPIFFAVDFDASPGQVSAYFAGVVSVIPHRAGIYGGYKVMGINVPWRWQTAAWSGGRLHGSAHIYQRAAAAGKLPAGCDQNVICKQVPFWGPKGVAELRPPAALAPKKAEPTSRGKHIDKALDAAKASQQQAATALSKPRNQGDHAVRRRRLTKAKALAAQAAAILKKIRKKK